MGLKANTNTDQIDQVVGNNDWDFEGLDVRKQGKKIILVSYELSCTDGQTVFPLPKKYIAGDKIRVAQKDGISPPEFLDGDPTDPDYALSADGLTLTLNSRIYVDAADKIIVEY